MQPVSYTHLAYNDGTSPAEGEKPDYARMGVRWGDCPALTSLELGASENFDGSQGYDYQTFLQDYKLVPRVYTGTKLEKDEDAAAYYEKAMSVFLPPFPFVHCRVRVWNTDIAFS